MIKVQILGISGNRYNTTDGLKTAIGNAKHNIWSWAWCDGDYLLGGGIYSSHVPYVPSGNKYILTLDDEYLILINTKNFKEEKRVSLPALSASYWKRLFCYNEEVAYVVDFYLNAKVLTAKVWKVTTLSQLNIFTIDICSTCNNLYSVDCKVDNTGNLLTSMCFNSSSDVNNPGWRIVKYTNSELASDTPLKAFNNKTVEQLAAIQSHLNTEPTSLVQSSATKVIISPMYTTDGSLWSVGKPSYFYNWKAGEAEALMLGQGWAPDLQVRKVASLVNSVYDDKKTTDVSSGLGIVNLWTNQWAGYSRITGNKSIRMTAKMYVDSMCFTDWTASTTGNPASVSSLSKKVVGNPTGTVNPTYFGWIANSYSTLTSYGGSGKLPVGTYYYEIGEVYEDSVYNAVNTTNSVAVTANSSVLIRWTLPYLNHPHPCGFTKLRIYRGITKDNLVCIGEVAYNANNFYDSGVGCADGPALPVVEALPSYIPKNYKPYQSWATLTRKTTEYCSSEIFEDSQAVSTTKYVPYNVDATTGNIAFPTTEEGEIGEYSIVPVVFDVSNPSNKKEGDSQYYQMETSVIKYDVSHVINYNNYTDPNEHYPDFSYIVQLDCGASLIYSLVDNDEHCMFKVGDFQKDITGLINIESAITGSWGIYPVCAKIGDKYLLYFNNDSILIDPSANAMLTDLFLGASVNNATMLESKKMLKLFTNLVGKLTDA